jgi:GT2 family glycosyltransferase
VEVSLVVVTHHSSSVLPVAIAAFRQQAADEGVAAEVVVVEQSEDDAETERAASCRPDVLLRRDNLGYAAGLNAGAAAASGRTLLLANPDVELRPGALAALLDALRQGWAVAGPQFEVAGFLFPPADDQRPLPELRRLLAGRSRTAWRRHARRELGRYQRVWSATTPQRVPTLSGALVALSAELSSRLGPWDEDYFLYFEETDWLRRASRLRLPLAIVPAARAIHRWGHAARPAAQLSRFAASRQRFYRRHHIWAASWLLRLPVSAGPEVVPWERQRLDDGWRWLLSPADGLPAALFTGEEPIEEAAARFCRECGVAAVSLLAWMPRSGTLRGPFRYDATRVEDRSAPPPA